MKARTVFLISCALAGGCARNSAQGTGLGSSKAPGVVVMRKDTELAEAVKKAQAGLPGFLQRLKHPKPGEHFAVEARFRWHTTFEHLWVDHLTLDKSLIRGVLADEPNLITIFHKGEAVSFPASNVSDWVIIDGNKKEGNFAESILRARQETAQAGK